MKLEITISPNLDIEQIRSLIETIRQGHEVSELLVFEAPTLEYSFSLPIVTVTVDSVPQRHFGDDAIATLRELAQAA